MAGVVCTCLHLFAQIRCALPRARPQDSRVLFRPESVAALEARFTRAVIRPGLFRCRRLWRGIARKAVQGRGLRPLQGMGIASHGEIDVGVACEGLSRFGVNPGGGKAADEGVPEGVEVDCAGSGIVAGNSGGFPVNVESPEKFLVRRERPKQRSWRFVSHEIFQRVREFLADRQNILSPSLRIRGPHCDRVRAQVNAPAGKGRKFILAQPRFNSHAIQHRAIGPGQTELLALGFRCLQQCPNLVRFKGAPLVAWVRAFVQLGKVRNRVLVRAPFPDCPAEKCAHRCQNRVVSARRNTRTHDDPPRTILQRGAVGVRFGPLLPLVDEVLLHLSASDFAHHLRAGCIEKFGEHAGGFGAVLFGVSACRKRLFEVRNVVGNRFALCGGVDDALFGHAAPDALR